MPGPRYGRGPMLHMGGGFARSPFGRGPLYSGGGFAPSDGFSPLEQSPVLWLRADVGVTTSSGKVTDWADQSGAGHHLSQGTDALRPTLVSAVIDGMPVVRFGPAAGNLVLPFAAAWAQATSGTVWAAWKHAAVNYYQLLLASSAGRPDIYVSYNSGGYEKPAIDYSPNTATWTAALADASVHVARWSWDTATGIYVSVDGGTEVYVSPITPAASNWTQLGHATLDLTADVAEMLVLPARVVAGSSADVAMRAYFRGRYPSLP